MRKLIPFALLGLVLGGCSAPVEGDPNPPVVPKTNAEVKAPEVKTETGTPSAPGQNPAEQGPVETPK